MTNSDQGIVAKAPETMLSGLLEKELFFPDGLLGFADCWRHKFRRFDPRVADASPFFYPLGRRTGRVLPSDPS